ncbi:unnamed protein product [Prunus armeniaca]|uniref:Amino acid transporter transmembrane domain-containing protein n=1 Tax=Prunus armeniaca TaxID=36596 RepID=A0A6J5WRH7_PRUAR|nr:unnamed protein product [Prunus armeniaca]
MKNKRQFSNVLLLCFILCTIGYASMAVLGYLMFGSTVQSQITLNLPTETLSSKIAIWTALINPLSKYALMMWRWPRSLQFRFKYNNYFVECCHHGDCFPNTVTATAFQKIFFDLPKLFT